MGQGLHRDTADYNAIKQQLIAGKWDVSGIIPHRQILDSNIQDNNWPADKYDYSAFAASVRNLVNELRVSGEIPPRPGTEEQEGEAAPAPPAETTAAPIGPTMPSGLVEMVPNDEVVVRNIYHMVEWKNAEQKEMATFIGKMPVSVTTDEVEAHIENNAQLVLRFTENKDMVSDRILTLLGAAPDSSFGTAFLASSLKMRGNVSSNPVYGVQRVPTPFEVEPDFSKAGVGLPFQVICTKLNGEPARILVINMARQCTDNPYRQKAVETHTSGGMPNAFGAVPPTPPLAGTGTTFPGFSPDHGISAEQAAQIFASMNLGSNVPQGSNIMSPGGFVYGSNIGHQFGQQPPAFGQQPPASGYQFGQQPPAFGQQPPAPGHQFGQQPPAFGQQPPAPGHQFGQQPPAFGQQPQVPGQHFGNVGGSFFGGRSTRGRGRSRGRGAVRFGGTTNVPMQAPAAPTFAAAAAPMPHPTFVAAAPQKPAHVPVQVPAPAPAPSPTFAAAPMPAPTFVAATPQKPVQVPAPAPAPSPTFAAAPMPPPTFVAATPQKPAHVPVQVPVQVPAQVPAPAPAPAPAPSPTFAAPTFVAAAPQKPAHVPVQVPAPAPAPSPPPVPMPPPAAPVPPPAAPVPAPAPPAMAPVAAKRNRPRTMMQAFDEHHYSADAKLPRVDEHDVEHDDDI